MANNLKKWRATIAQPINLPRIICNHVVSKEHSLKHRKIVGVVIMIVGVVIMIVGVVMAKGFFLPIGLEVVHVVCECTGFGLHALGAVPWIEPKD